MGGMGGGGSANSLAVRPRVHRRYEVSYKSMLMVESKLSICRVLVLVSEMRVDMHVSEILHHFRAAVEAGDPMWKTKNGAGGAQAVLAAGGRSAFQNSNSSGGGGGDTSRDGGGRLASSHSASRRTTARQKAKAASL